MLFPAIGRDSSETFRLGYVAGLAHYLTSLYWLLFIPFPVGAIAAWLSLSAYLALYPAVWVWLSWKLIPIPRPSLGSVSGASRSDTETQLAGSGSQVLSLGSWQRLRWTLSCAFLWVALEMIVGRFLTGFPWNFLGVSQYEMLPLIQIASVTGVYGLSFLIVWFSVSLANTAFILVWQPTRSWSWRSAIALPMVTLAIVVAFGFHQAMRDQLPSRE